jgi:hypothetical protein
MCLSRWFDTIDPTTAATPRGCGTGTRFVRFPCHLVLAARRVLHVGQPKVQSGEADGHDR